MGAHSISELICAMLILPACLYQGLAFKWRRGDTRRYGALARPLACNLAGRKKAVEHVIATFPDAVVGSLSNGIIHPIFRIILPPIDCPAAACACVQIPRAPYFLSPSHFLPLHPPSILLYQPSTLSHVGIPSSRHLPFYTADASTQQIHHNGH